MPIETIADFEGKKGRFVGLASSVMAKFGIAVSPLPTSEVYSALDKGVIDLADRGDLPFFALQFVGLLLVLLVPDLVTWLPRLMLN